MAELIDDSEEEAMNDLKEEEDDDRMNAAEFKTWPW
jgi:hypothetical protein